MSAALASAKQQQEGLVHSIRSEARQCISEGNPGWAVSVASLYSSVLSSGRPPTDSSRYQNSTRAAASVMCPDVVRLAVRLNLVEAHVAETYDKAKQATIRARDAATAAKCSPRRVETQPTEDDLQEALSDYILANCAGLPIALRMLSAGQTEGLPAIPVANFKVENRTCAIRALTLKINIGWHEVSQRNCARTGDRSYTCNIVGRVSCQSDDYNQVRNDLFCSFYTRPQQGTVVASFEQSACAWKVQPLQRN